MNILDTLTNSREKIRGQRIIIRDDQYEFSELQKILEQAARSKVSINLIDSGRLDQQQLELLSQFPFSFYTSDCTREEFINLTLLAEILAKKKRPVYLFLEKNLNGTQDIFNHLEFFTSIFVSSREKAVDLDWLAALSSAASVSGPSLVYYHHQKLEEKLAEVSQKSVWFHISNRNISEDQEIMLLDLIKEVRKRKGQPVVHLERVQPEHFLELLDRSGAFLIFNLPPVETGSKLYKLEKSWRKKQLPEKAFYLYPDIMA
ncbi:MAG: hypothetical protein H5U07_02160 [Candidatus Aminicenantes bacterium]|nr:hypothetical protein [Candidatus Aminicenantes bacterium]